MWYSTTASNWRNNYFSELILSNFDKIWLYIFKHSYSFIRRSDHFIERLNSSPRKDFNINLWIWIWLLDDRSMSCDYLSLSFLQEFEARLKEHSNENKKLRNSFKVMKNTNENLKKQVIFFSMISFVFISIFHSIFPAFFYYFFANISFYRQRNIVSKFQSMKKRTQVCKIAYQICRLAFFWSMYFTVYYRKRNLEGILCFNNSYPISKIQKKTSQWPYRRLYYFVSPKFSFLFHITVFLSTDFN